MHGDTAEGVSLAPAITRAVLRLVEQPDVFPRIRERCGIVQYQDRSRGARKTLPSGSDMARQYVGLAHPIISEKPIRSLGVRPVLARQRYTLAACFRKLVQNELEPSTQPAVAELATQHFIRHPRWVLGRIGLKYR